MRVLCIGRHRFLSEHLGHRFDELGVDTTVCVGMDEATRRIALDRPDAIACDYDLLTPARMAIWKADPQTATLPIIAVSLTRHPDEAHLAEASGVVSFLYLPTLDVELVYRALSAVRQKTGGVKPPPTPTWPETTRAAQLR